MMPSRIRNKGKVFRDPVHRLIRIEPKDEFVLALIDTPEFQRLRRVRQLGVSSLTYHGAEHSRFAHSLGVFNFAQRIIFALQRRYGPGDPVSAFLVEHERSAKAAALLHDLGHGPFSHMIERAAGSGFDHEAMTTRIIEDPESSVNAVLRAHGLDPAVVAHIIAKLFPNRLVVDIVSSQLDADRMDYLLRDSLMTGVEYGVYDAEWLLNAMCAGRDPDAAPDEPPELALTLCLDRDRGLFAAEQLILARHHMMHQVYMHRVTRGYEVMLLNLFEQAAAFAAAGDLPPGTPDVIGMYFQHGIRMPLVDWMDFDETAVVAAMQAWARSSASQHAWLRRAANAFLRRERIYRGFSIGSLDPGRVMAIPKELAAAGLREGTDWGLDNGEHLPYKGAMYSASKGGREEESVSILLADGDPANRGRPIETESGILQNLDNDLQSLARLYVDRDKHALAKAALNKLKIA